MALLYEIANLVEYTKLPPDDGKDFSSLPACFHV
jgi:hypothetical protein